MMATLAGMRTRSAGCEGLLVGLALVHGGLLLAWPSIPLIALAMWWNANTISHNFIHRPFFRRRALNRAFSCYLSVVLGFPQSAWRARHLKHHELPEGLPEGLREGSREGLGDRLGVDVRDPRPLKPSPIEIGLVLALWAAMAGFAPHFALAVYLPGYLLGLGLCGLQGHYEHVRGPVSHYGRLYNLICFNDGYHIEHHSHSGLNWRDLPAYRAIGGNSSRYPATLRWLEFINLRALERLTLHHPALQRFVIDRHERAIRGLLIELPPVNRVGIVGGGLFPRTAIILQRLLPLAKLTLIDLSSENLAIARPYLAGEVQEINKQFDPAEECDFDLLVIPLSFVGNRRPIYERPPARAVLVHDWIWKPVAASAIVSWLLLKRLNLVVR
jgi:hypothetical protein